MDRPRDLLINHIAAKDNLSLIITRQVGTASYRHAFISELVANDCLLSSDSKEADFVFPLYLYSNGERQLNLNPLFIEKIHAQYSKTISPESILAYIYAILHSQKYRTSFLNLLKLDFPRIPIVKDYQDFLSLSDLGAQLIELHLMKKQFPPTIKYEIVGSNNIASVKYTDSKLYINKTQYFDKIPENVWNFYIGGHQVLDKWLKSRMKRELSVQEVLHFIQIVEVLKETIRIMDEIDKKNFLHE
jgi:predicted helicase